MTVHGAKGLEADDRLPGRQRLAAGPPQPRPEDRVARRRPRRHALAAGLGAERTRQAPAAVKARIDALRADSEDEYRRLLYVAVTRARDRLVHLRHREAGRRPRQAEALARRGHRGARGGMRRDRRGRRPRRAGMAAARRHRRRRPGASRRRWPSPPQRPAVARAARPAARRRRCAASRHRPRSPATARRHPPVHRWCSRRGEAMLAAERGRLVHRLLQSLPDIAPASAGATRRRYLAALRRRLDRGGPRRAARRASSRSSTIPISRRSSRRAAGPRSRSPAAIGGRDACRAGSTGWRSPTTGC